MVEFGCPVALSRATHVSMADGAGGKSMQDFIQRIIRPIYGQGFAPDHDGAVFEISGKVAFTTDSYVVNPLFFPGGDIGKLAVFGTINDLAMCGAIPRYMSCSFIIEEGLALEVLERVCGSMVEAAKANDVAIVTGDTKVVGRGQADGLYINTSGVGSIRSGVDVHPSRVQAGDAIIVSGDLGRHGIAVLSCREGFSFENPPISDCASLAKPIAALVDAGVLPKCLRDLTRGGLAAALHEISTAASVGMEIHEKTLLVEERVRGACEILGLDPIQVANEGRFIAIVSADDVFSTLETLKSQSLTADAALIGYVTSTRGVEMISPYGSRRLLPPLVGELLPRIC